VSPAVLDELEDEEPPNCDLCLKLAKHGLGAMYMRIPGQWVLCCYHYQKMKGQFKCQHIKVE
jgi:hypothetical protein